jgi:hypothetical protein
MKDINDSSQHPPVTISVMAKGKGEHRLGQNATRKLEALLEN